MEIIQLHEFCDLAKTRNFQETADNLHTSQSNISKHLLKLENELGVKLFQRTSRSVKLNSYGEVFYDYATQIVALHSSALNRLSDVKNEDDRILSIGFHPMLVHYGLIDLLSDFSAAHPEIQISYHENPDAESLLKITHCNIVFAAEGDIPTSDLKRVPYVHDRLCAILPKDHPLAQEDSITLDQIKNEPFIKHSISSNSFSVEHLNFNRLFEGKDFTPNIVAQIGRTSTILQFVRNGLGISILFRKHALVDEGSIKIVDIVPEISVNICAYYLKNRPLPKSAQLFIDYLKSEKNNNQ